MADIYNNNTITSQKIYDAYNTLIFSEDTRVFNKMIKKVELYNEVKHMSGDILEFGVFKGSGIGLFLKLKRLYEPNSLMKVIGFDFFDPNILENSLDGLNKQMMSSVLNRVDTSDLSYDNVSKRLSSFNRDNFILIKGNAVDKSKEYNSNSPGARIKIMYMDIDLGEPTYHILRTLWNKVVKGGIVVFDEYAYHKWDESDGVDKFLNEIPGEFKFIDTKICAPSAYIIKL